jgi:hypothetical protein
MPGRKRCEYEAQTKTFSICIAGGIECDDLTKDTCEGNVLNFCEDGFRAKVDCTKLGFKGCAPLRVGAYELGAVCK